MVKKTTFGDFTISHYFRIIVTLAVSDISKVTSLIFKCFISSLQYFLNISYLSKNLIDIQLLLSHSCWISSMSFLHYSAKSKHSIMIEHPSMTCFLFYWPTASPISFFSSSHSPFLTFILPFIKHPSWNTYSSPHSRGSYNNKLSVTPKLRSSLQLPCFANICPLSSKT